MAIESGRSRAVALTCQSEVKEMPSVEKLAAARQGVHIDLTTFSNHLHSRYQLSFEPNDPHPGLHQIRVKLRDPGKNWNVLYRSSYWADGQKGSR